MGMEAKVTRMEVQIEVTPMEDKKMQLMVFEYANRMIIMIKTRSKSILKLLIESIITICKFVLGLQLINLSCPGQICIRLRNFMQRTRV